MKKHLLIVCAIAAALSLCMLAGCSTTSKGSVNLDNDGLAENNGGDLTVTLKGNPTTGYEWTYTIEGDKVEFVSSDYKQDNEDKEVAGAGGTYTFKFKVTGATEAKIHFDYARSWEETPDDRWCEVRLESSSNGNITKLIGVN